MVGTERENFRSVDRAEMAFPQSSLPSFVRLFHHFIMICELCYP